MTQGVLYITFGSKCVIRLCVSLLTLRKHYTGDCVIVHDAPVMPWLRDIAAHLNVRLVETESIPDGGFVKKTMLMQRSPFDLSVFLDADTIVFADPSPLFALAEAHEFCVPQFTNWVTTGNKIAGRIRAWADLVTPKQLEDALAYGPAINTGVLAFKRGSEIIKLWPEWTRLGAKDRRTPQVADEVPMHYLMPYYPCHVLDSTWNYSVKHETKPLSAAKIIHFHGRKHVGDFPACRLWKDAYRDLLAAFPQWRAELTQDYGDRRLKQYIRAQQREERRKHPVIVLTAANGGQITGPPQTYTPQPVSQSTSSIFVARHDDSKSISNLSDMTVVTAVSAGKYVEKLRRNLPLWMNMANLNVQNFIVFSVNMDLHDMTLDFAR